MTQYTHILTGAVKSENLTLPEAGRLIQLPTIILPPIPDHESYTKTAAAKNHWSSFYWKNNLHHYPMNKGHSLLPYKELLVVLPTGKPFPIVAHVKLSEDCIELSTFLSSEMRIAGRNKDTALIQRFDLTTKEHSLHYKVDGKFLSFQEDDPLCKNFPLVIQATWEMLIRWLIFTKLNKFEVALETKVGKALKTEDWLKYKPAMALKSLTKTEITYSPVALKDIVLDISQEYIDSLT